MAVWTYRLNIKDVFHDDNRTIIQKRDEIVRRIKRASFYNEDDTMLFDIVDELSGVEDVEEFDFVWSRFYDWADGKRVWVETF
jgi:hypothetical protein